MRRSRQGIEAELRRRIRSGIYLPGARMPSHRVLQQELGVSSVTLQRAFDQLVEQGYVVPRGSLGTFIADLLPNRTRIALVFPEEPGHGGWNRFWSTARKVGEEWDEGPGRFRVYAMQRDDLASPGHRRLVADVAAGGLAGAVFVHAPSFLQGSPVFAPGFPRVCISGGGARDRDRYQASVVDFIDDGIIERILRRFQAAGRRRCAVVTAMTIIDQLTAACLPMLRGIGLETRPEWWVGLPVDPAVAGCARAVTRLLCSGSDRQRPDCLLIGDDNLVPHATAGIIDAGVRVPEELAVVAHANFPGPTLAAVPCLRYGPDMHALLRAAATEVFRLAAGEAPRLVGVPLDMPV